MAQRGSAARCRNRHTHPLRPCQERQQHRRHAEGEPGGFGQNPTRAQGLYLLPQPLATALCREPLLRRGALERRAPRTAETLRTASCTRRTKVHHHRPCLRTLGRPDPRQLRTDGRHRQTDQRQLYLRLYHLRQMGGARQQLRHQCTVGLLLDDTARQLRIPLLRCLNRCIQNAQRHTGNHRLQQLLDALPHLTGQTFPGDRMAREGKHRTRREQQHHPSAVDVQPGQQRQQQPAHLPGGILQQRGEQLP